MARDAKGEPCPIDEGSSHCLLGALKKSAIGDDEAFTEASEIVLDTCGRLYKASIVTVNDSWGYEAVMRVLKESLE